MPVNNQIFAFFVLNYLIIALTFAYFRNEIRELKRELNKRLEGSPNWGALKEPLIIDSVPGVRGEIKEAPDGFHRMDEKEIENLNKTH